MLPDFQTCYRAHCARDARYDGRFFTAVTSTGIYCRPVCPAVAPKAANCRFFATAAAARAAGLRSEAPRAGQEGRSRWSPHP